MDRIRFNGEREASFIMASERAESKRVGRGLRGKARWKEDHKNIRNE